MDMRLKFKKEAVDYTDRTCIIVMNAAGTTVGLIVDNVAEVLTIDDDNIVPPPDIRSGLQNRYVSGIGKVDANVKLLLDCEKLFRDDELDTVQKIGGEDQL
jgi:purine-binding chemotaxis protein CheW